jgi:membrane protein required for colicin V production
MLGPLTYLDVAVLAIASFSGLLALYRGLTREILSIVSWGVAAGAGLYFWLNHEAVAREMAQQIHAPVLFAQIGISFAIFLIVLVVVHLVTLRISDTILDSRIGMIDRILGCAFGVVRGFAIVLILYMFYAYFFPAEKQHEWVRKAMARNLLENAGASVQPALQAVIERLRTRSEDQQQGILRRPQEREFALLYPPGIVRVPHGASNEPAARIGLGDKDVAYVEARGGLYGGQA